VLPRAIKKRTLASGGFPYDDKLDEDEYATQMLAAQRQLALLQHDQAKTGKRIVIVFEGRDAAGKGGSIATYLENLNPRFNMSVALPKPSDRSGRSGISSVMSTGCRRPASRCCSTGPGTTGPASRR